MSRSEPKTFLFDLFKEISKRKSSFKGPCLFAQLLLDLLIQAVLIGALEIYLITKDLVVIVDIKHVLKSFVTLKYLVLHGACRLEDCASCRFNDCVWYQIWDKLETRIIFSLF